MVERHRKGKPRRNAGGQGRRCVAIRVPRSNCLMRQVAAAVPAQVGAQVLVLDVLVEDGEGGVGAFVEGGCHALGEAVCCLEFRVGATLLGRIDRSTMRLER